jgi:pectate lyase
MGRHKYDPGTEPHHTAEEDWSYVAAVTEAPHLLRITETSSAGSLAVALQAAVYIRNKQTGGCIDVTDWAREDGIGIQQFQWHGKENQIWIVAPGDPGYVTIRSRHSDKVLTVPASSLDDDLQVVQAAYTGGRNQQWKARQESDGSFAFAAAHSNKYLHVRHGRADNHTPIVQKHWPQGDSQRWDLVVAEL